MNSASSGTIQIAAAELIKSGAGFHTSSYAHSRSRSPCCKSQIRRESKLMAATMVIKTTPAKAMAAGPVDGHQIIEPDEASQ